ncbi:hypothetical protein C8A03DRAFT_18863 [Achaetomium macrosporum]|uniref:Protein kinase domain-containing protein n=1 Tax=Achaetomium macrosporum TaxID=79813 RepID=A0AAN7C477_9PEZI|nr:hypothetical protein C8A03DRAFT_18863 [Achaetomium macrosporum]
MFKTGTRRFLFIRKFGSGLESVAQLVEDVDTGENIIRKATSERLRPNRVSTESLAEFRPKKPREVRILEVIRKTFRAPDPELPYYLVECYGHEYIKSTDTDDLGRPKYHSISYWKLCNGSSVRSRWLTGDFVPPVVAVARMVRQVFSTLHYLYTAGEHPIYHDDVHFGNIWIHWRENEVLPDFYLGDFGNAGFADSKYEDLYLENKALIGRPVDDLHKFVRNLDLLLDIMGSRRGYGDPGLKALRRLAQDIDRLIFQLKDAPATHPPPDLGPFIDWAQDIEDIFSQGGNADETLSDTYIKWITDERDMALNVERERALVVHATKEEALRPRCLKALAEGFDSVPVAIHGPWHLVRVDWVVAEEGGVTHHRPNGHRFVEDLSTTGRGPDQVEPGFLETDSSAGSIDDASFNFTSTVDSASPPDSSSNAQEAASPSFSWTEGDDASLQAEPSRRLSKKKKKSSNKKKGSSKGNPHSAQTVVVDPAREDLLDRLEEKLRLWHALLHGPKCGCPEEVFSADIEAALRSEKVRSATKGLKQVRLKPVHPYERARHRRGVLTYRRS